MMKKVLGRPLDPTTVTGQPCLLSSAGISFLKRPSIFVKTESNPKAFSVPAKPNYKAYENFGLTFGSTTLLFVILNSGFGSIFIMLSKIT